jgi:hypothetical protein
MRGQEQKSSETGAGPFQHSSRRATLTLRLLLAVGLFLSPATAEIPVVETAAQIRQWREGPAASGRAYADDLMAAAAGLLFEEETPKLPAGRYCLYMPLSITPYRDPRIIDIAVRVQAGNASRLLTMLDFPREAGFYEFALEFTGPGGESAPVRVLWAIGRSSAKNRGVDTRTPGVPQDGSAAVEPEEVVKSAEEEIQELEARQRAGRAAKGRVSLEDAAQIPVRLTARLPIVVLRQAQPETLSSPYRRLYEPGTERFTLCEDGKPNAVIVAGADLRKTVERDVPLVAERLRAGLGRITGLKFVLSEEGADDRQASIEIGHTARAVQSGIEALTADLGHDGFVIRITPNRLFIAGRTPGGTRYGVNHFLNHVLGVREYHPDALWHVAPFARTIQLPVGELKEDPDFALRSFSGGGFSDRDTGKRTVDWMPYNGLQYHTDSLPQPYGFHHHMATIFQGYRSRQARKQAQEILKKVPRPAEGALPETKKEEAEGEDETDSEFEQAPRQKPRREPEDPLCRVFAHLLANVPPESQGKFIDGMVKGEAGWQPCFSSPDTVDVCFDAASVAFEEDPELQGFSLGYNDGPGGYCACARCRKLLEGEDKVLVDYFKWWNFSPTYCWLLNQVAERVAEKFPGKMVGGLAYHFTSCPPKKVRLRENVLLLKTMYLAESGAAAAISGCDRWKGFISHLGIYEYAYPTTAPRYQLQDLQELFKHQAAWGGNFYYAEAYPDWQIEGPKYWLMAQLLWDNSADIGALLDEYCRDLFGRAAKPMRAYWDVCARIWPDAKQRGVPVSPWVGPVLRGLALFPHVDRMKALLSEAETLAEDELVRKRIQHFREPVDHDMTILAEVGRVVARTQERQESLQGWVEMAAKAVLELDRLKPQVDTVRHHGNAPVRGLAEPDWMPDLAARTFLGISESAAAGLRREKDAPADPSGFPEVLLKRCDAARQGWASEEMSSAWKRVWKAMEPTCATICIVPKVTAKPVIDGVPDPEFVRQAQRTRFAWRETGREPAPTPPHTAEVHLGHDETALYLVSTSDEDAPSVFEEHSRPDSSLLFTGDALSVVLVPGCQLGQVIYITVDARNHVRDQNAAQGVPWSTRGQVRTQFDAAGKTWTVEMAVPFSDLGIPAEPMQVVGANFLRHYKVDLKDYESSPHQGLRSLSWFPPAQGSVGIGSPLQTGLLLLR